MRVRMIAAGTTALLLLACNRSAGHPERQRAEDKVAANAGPVALGSLDRSTVSQSETPAAPSSDETWTPEFDFTNRLIVRTGQAVIEVDSLEPAIAELRRIAQRVGGFVADASVQSGRNQLRSATLQLKVPAARFDDLTLALGPLGRLQSVNVNAEDVSEEFVDVTARVANSRRLEDRLVDLLRTRTGKLQDVLAVEHELARVREEIERMEGRLRYLKASAQLSTLSVSLSEPPPIIASHPGRSIITEAFKTAWRNFVGLLAGVIASLGVVAPILIFGWGTWVVAKRYRRRPA
jgi:Domain of unknown function (DUF4349)